MRTWPRYGDNPRKYRETKFREQTAEELVYSTKQQIICPECGSKDVSTTNLKSLQCNSCFAGWLPVNFYKKGRKNG